MTTELLADFLKSNNIEYKIDNNPTPEKVSRIQKALDRKSGLMDLAVNAYKSVRGL